MLFRSIEVFIDEHTIETLEKIMARQGYLDGREMARSFRMLRSNPLIWHYVVHNYLYGETPPAFDVLYWNTDVTRMPCSYRQCVTMYTEEMPWLKGKDLEQVMGKAICDWLGWKPA